MHAPTRVALFALGALLIPHVAAAQDGEVEFIVYNRTSTAVTVFANWEGRSRGVRLGELRGRRDRTYTVEMRGTEVWLGVDPLANVGRRAGRPVTGADRYEDEYIDVRAGDRIVWEIRLLDPLDLFYRRVESVSVSGDTERRDPRGTRYTAISSLGIQQAQNTEDDSLRAEAYREVLESVYDGLAREDDNPMSYLHLGIVQTGLKNYLAADSAFDRAEALYPDYLDEDDGTNQYRLNGWIEAYNDATGRLEAQDPEGAIELFRFANVLYDKRPEAYLNIGAQTANLGDLNASIEAWRSAIAVIESPDADAGDDETREGWDTQFWIMAQTNLGQVLERDGRSGESVAVYEAVLERDPENAQARASLALALAGSGQGDAALSIFDEILGREDAAPLDYYNAGVSLYTADQMDRAALAFQKTVERSPMYRDAVQNLAQTLYAIEDYEAQVPHSEKLIELDPYNEFAYQMHVRALLQVGREYQAVFDILQALPFVIDNLQLQPMASGARVSGVAMNKALEPGTSITLRFTFYDDDGNPLGSADTEVTLTVPDVANAFQVSFEADQQVLGYGYEVVN